MKFKKSLVVLGMAIIMCSSVVFGAVNHQKVEALLVSNTIIKDGKQVLQGTNLINYNGTLYVPLRKFGEAVNTDISYKDGIVYLGEEVMPTQIIKTKEVETSKKLMPEIEGCSYLDNGYLIRNKENIKNYQNFYNAAIKDIKSVLKDPVSAQFDYAINFDQPPYIYSKNSEIIVAGRVRGMNGFGGIKVSTYIVVFTDINTIKLHIIE